MHAVGTEITYQGLEPPQSLFHIEPIFDIDMSSQIENDIIP